MSFMYTKEQIKENAAAVDATWAKVIAEADAEKQAETYGGVPVATRPVVRRQEPETAPMTDTVACSCGHTVSRINVMNTSSGTSCPDCYDRMSE